MSDRRFLLLLALGLVVAGLLLPLAPILPVDVGPRRRERPRFAADDREVYAEIGVENRAEAANARREKLARALAPLVPLARWDGVLLEKGSAAGRSGAELLDKNLRLHFAVTSSGVTAAQLWREQERSHRDGPEARDRFIRVLVVPGGEGHARELLSLLAAPPVKAPLIKPEERGEEPRRENG